MNDVLTAPGRTALLAAAVAFPYLFPDPVAVRAAVELLILVLAGLSLLPVVGWLRTVALSAPASAATGAVAAATLLSADQALPLAVLAAGAAGAATALVAIAAAPRRPQVVLPLTSLLVTVVVWGLLLPRVRLVSFARPVFVGVDLSADRALYLLTLAFVVACVAATANLARSRAGRETAALGAAPDVALRSGAEPRSVWLRTVALSGVPAGLAGLVAALVQQGVPPSAMFSPAVAMTWLAVPLLGGAPWISGTLVGAAILRGVPALTGLSVVGVGGVGLAVAAAALPDGIVGAVRAWPWRLAERRREGAASGSP